MSSSSMISSVSGGLLLNSALAIPYTRRLLVQYVSNLQQGQWVQIIEYESLSTICLHCGLYGHLKKSCLETHQAPSAEDNVVPLVTNQQQAEEYSFGPWMMVEHKQRKSATKQTISNNSSSTPLFQGSRFTLLSAPENENNNAFVLSPAPLADVSIQQVRSAASIPRGKPQNKGKLSATTKSTKSISLCKSSPVTFVDFPILTRNHNAASSSNPPPLDLLKHSTIVVDENLDTNIIVLPNNLPPPTGEPPNKQAPLAPVLDPHAQVDTSLQSHQLEDISDALGGA
ncbi:hypothetical protein V6N12_000149 [Hibiscus sabdariffa]|uniref:CCHC-type domain-containing protein n=1 Tax=Hibiscus sabdariffa TaxID=183260 RepID=A0ABR2B2R1_9ROSI